MFSAFIAEYGPLGLCNSENLDYFYKYFQKLTKILVTFWIFMSKTFLNVSLLSLFCTLMCNTRDQLLYPQ